MKKRALRMDIRRKLFFIITASILVTAVPGAALMYAYTEHHMLGTAATEQEEAAQRYVDAVRLKLLHGEPKLKALAHLLEQALSVPLQPDEVAAFARMAERNTDGVWRNRRPAFDGSRESGLFLPDDGKLTDLQKVHHLRIKLHLDHLGEASNALGENLWYLSPQRSEIIFDRAYPNFAFEQKADNDYTQTPWLTSTAPLGNPQRGLTLTPPLFDPVPRVWMVSAVYPLYVNGQWAGSLGEDMPLSEAFKPLSAQSKRYPGMQHFLLDRSGNFVLAGAWQKQIETGPLASRPDLSQEPQLAQLLQTQPSLARAMDRQIMVQGRPYLAVGAPLDAVGWTYFSLTPVDEIMAPTRHLFLVRAGLACALLVLGGSLIGYAVGSNITRRIRALRDVMHGHVRNNSLRASMTLAGSDEIGEVARAYNAMADEVERNITERQQAQATLASNEELWRFALDGAGYGVWDWNIAAATLTFSQRSQEMLELPPVIQGDIQSAWLARVHPDDQVAAINEMREHLRGDATAYAGEYRVRRSDGHYQWLLTRGRVVQRDAGGKPLRVIGTHTDISVRKGFEAHLADSKMLLQTLLHAIPDLVWLKDLDGHYLACNQRFEEFFGAAENAIVGKTDYDFISRELADFFRSNDQRAMQAGGLHRNEEWITFVSDGHRELLETTKLPVRGADGQIIGVLGIGHDVTHSRQLADALQLREQYQRALLDTFPFNVWLKDEHSRFLAVNQRFAASFGWSSAQSLVGKSDLDIASADLAEAYRADDRAVLASGQPQDVEEPVEVGGVRQWHETYKAPVNIAGRVIGTVGFSRDITARKKAEENLKLAASVFSHAREAIMITSADGAIVDVNEAFTRITGYSRDDVLGHNPRMLSSGRQSADFYAALWQDLMEQGFWYGEIWNRRKSGEVYAEMQTISAVRDANGSPHHYVSLFSDITVSKEHERQLHHIAHFDALTDLPNRVLLADRLQQALAQSQRRNRAVAVAYLDLDGFKLVNDTHGHSVGDQLLMALSIRMKQALREGDTLARIGGDEFVAVLADLDKADDCVPLLQRLLDAAAQAVPLGAFNLQVSASLGVTFYPQVRDVGADQLLRQADQAMYQAKLAGKNRFHTFNAV